MGRGVISPLILVMIIVILLITLRTSTHEPPSKQLNPKNAACSLSYALNPKPLSPTWLFVGQL